MNPFHVSVAGGPVGSTWRTLTPSQQALVAVFQTLRFGRVRHLRVRGGQPDVRDGVFATRTVKVPGANGPHPAARQPDFALKGEVRAFLEHLRDIGDGEVSNVQVRDGLPVSFEVEESFPT